MTEANEKGIYIGRTDFPLSDRGRAELSNKLDEFEYPRVERVYVSPLKRCTETAEILFPYQETQSVSDLQELDFGEFEGKSVDELIQREDYKAWLKGGMDNRPPKGESLNELCTRTYKALHEIIMDMMRDELRHCAVVTHAGIVTNILTGFGLPKLTQQQAQCAPGEGFDLLITAQMWQQSQAFEILGAVPYLRE